MSNILTKMKFIEVVKKYFLQLKSRMKRDEVSSAESLPFNNIDNPYLAARTEWNFMFNDLLKGKKNWQWIAISMIVANVILLIGFISLSLQTKYVPYAVKVDAMGNTAFAGYLAKADQQINPTEMNAFVRRYISTVRSVIADPVAEKQSLDYVYATTRGSALNFINSYFHDNDPFKRAKNSTIEVQINAALPKSQQTWQVDWTEIERNLDGNIINQSRYEALVTVAQHPSQDPKEINLNPLSLFTTNLSWSQQI